MTRDEAFTQFLEAMEPIKRTDTELFLKIGYAAADYANIAVTEALEHRRQLRLVRNVPG